MLSFSSPRPCLYDPLPNTDEVYCVKVARIAAQPAEMLMSIVLFWGSMNKR